MLLQGNICRKRSHTAPGMSFTVWTTVWMVSKPLKTKRLAERVGFEPTLEFPLNTLSKRAPSATRPSLRRATSQLYAKFVCCVSEQNELCAAINGSRICRRFGNDCGPKSDKAGAAAREAAGPPL